MTPGSFRNRTARLRTGLRRASWTRGGWIRAVLVMTAAFGLVAVPLEAGATRHHARASHTDGATTTGDAASAVAAQDTARNVEEMADHVVVHKSQRRMELMHGGKVLRTYHVALGMYPEGHKEREGDSRTPEGRYYLDERNPRSDYFLSIHVSYPNPADEARARRGGWDPGGAIMIHGRPNELKREPKYYETHDWTDGCISVSDSDMLEIWLMTPPGIPIDILP